MIIFEDIFTGHELFSDAYPTKLVDEVMYESEGQLITIDNSIDEAAIGGNASAEDSGEVGAEDAKETAINLVYAFKLKKYDMDKKAYAKHLKEYGQRILANLKEDGKSDVEIKAIREKMNKKCGEILKDFKNFDVYINEEFNEKGMLPLLNYRPDGITPYFTYFALGVKGVKC